MSEAKSLSGSCLCGSVSYTVKSETGHVGTCHCAMCRKWSGGVLFALKEAFDLKLEGEENLGVYKSSDWGERCFCKTCGSNLFWRSEQFDYLGIMAGAIDDQSALQFTYQIYVDHKAPYIEFANETSKMTEAEFLAQFVQPETDRN